MLRRISITVVAAIGLVIPTIGFAPSASASPSTVADTTDSTNGIVYASVQVGDRTIIGGSFTTVGGLLRANVAALLADGSVDPTFDPSVNGVVYAVEAADDGSKLFLGGGFTTVGGLTHAKLAAVNPVTGALITSWKAATNSNFVRALATSSDTLYVGGTFSRISGKAINRLAAVDVATGVVDTSFAPRPDNTVRAVGLSPDGTKVYVGGAFTTIAGVARPGMAELDTAGAATDFAPTDGGVALSLDVMPDGNRVFFNTTTNRIHAYDPATSNSPAYILRLGGDTQAMEATDDEVYIGGHFTRVPDLHLSRVTLASFDPATGAFTDWNPLPGDWHFGVWAISAGPDYLTVGGDFNRMSAHYQEGVARFPGTP